MIFTSLRAAAFLLLATPAVFAPRRDIPHLIAMGLDGSLDDAFKSATQNMATWLADDDKFTPVEIAELFGSAAEYRVSEAADRNAGIVLKLPRSAGIVLKLPRSVLSTLHPTHQVGHRAKTAASARHTRFRPSALAW